jgi:hypothetical protein
VWYNDAVQRAVQRCGTTMQYDMWYDDAVQRAVQYNDAVQ